MNRPAYTLARSTALADETYFHRRNLAERLLALAGGAKLVLAPATLGRARAPNGHAVRIYARTGGKDVALAYVLRPGMDSLEIRERLWAELDGLQPQVIARRAA
ncbi:hypothetical protein [Caulobacter sp. S45]|uniref:hypothetical protein n=1 Tax=Caulobacter sp. S45 TaxID=1641861 RepID=UPI0015766117|nr:hypothetical protein [Caulobacter sp. S45]